MSACRQGLRLVSFTMVLLLLGLAATTSADTIYVCWDGSGDYLTIQAGIDAAQDGDEVVVCDGVYTGEGNKNLDYHGKAITVRSANGPENCIIDGESEFPSRGFDFHSGETETSVVDGFTITGGLAIEGSGICCSESSPIVVNCVISGNTAGFEGGGICCSESTSTFVNCVISGNTAIEGGGIYCSESSSTFVNCAVSDNTAAGGDGGGGIFCILGAPTIVNCVIAENTADPES